MTDKDLDFPGTQEILDWLDQQISEAEALIEKAEALNMIVSGFDFGYLTALNQLKHFILFEGGTNATS